jgi:hypothetical protein
MAVTANSRRASPVTTKTRVAAVGLVVAAGVFMLTASGAGPIVGSNTLRVPARGASPKFLADGSPVWVVRHQDGSVSVLDAVAEELGGVGILAHWCERASTLEGVFGGIFDEYGNHKAGPSNYGLGLLQYAYVPAGSNTVRVTRAIGRLPRLHKPLEQRGPYCNNGDFYALTTAHNSTGIPWASPDEAAKGQVRRFRGSVIRAGSGAALCIPSKVHCDWRLKAVGVELYAGGFGPTTLIGRLRPGSRVSDLIEADS